ncbi:MAG: hypothetical protein JWN29_2434 [Acidimicrobiales bacterium]|nr:hypothetical protein [Acidimicrobiales bacterium]
MSNLSDVAALATAGGTLVLAVATFSSVRSANRAAKAAERSLLASLRPVLAPARLQDPEQKISWVDGHWTRLPGGMAGVELVDDVIYLSMPLRNVGTGMAVLHGWHVWPEFEPSRDRDHTAPDTFRRQTRDLYVAPGDIGFWQGALRDPAEPVFGDLAESITQRRLFIVDLLYGDHEGGQRAISRFSIAPTTSGDAWLCTVARHWNLDRADPR